MNEKLSIVDEDELMVTIRQWFTKWLLVICVVLCIISVFFFLIIHSQNQSISSVLDKNRNVETALQRLSDMLNESSLTRLFKSLYDKTIVDVRVRMEGIHKQVEEDHESFVRDYTLMTSDYNAVQRHIKWQREQIQLLQEQITDLKSALEETNNQLNLIRHRVRIDGTDRIDYAYEKNGGRVLTGRKWTTEPPSGAYFAWSIQQADPSLAINPPTEKGYCYPMDSSKAMFTVRVLQPRNPEYFSIDHISQYVTEDRRTAPKLMEIWGYENESSQPIRLVSKCEYDIHGETTQFCKSEYKGEKLFQLFQLVIQDNWGAKYTCLYRFRVHY
ncbi:hypothetical protein WA171_001437, partial [Blastocystis sp. BT1]